MTKDEPGPITSALPLMVLERDPEARLEVMPSAGRNDIAGMFVAYICLLFGLPAVLIISPLGAAGSPANILALCFFILWALARLPPGLGIARGRQPMRVAYYLLGLALLLSYTAGMLRPLENREISNSDRGLLNVMAWSGIMLLAMDGIRTREALHRIVRVLVGGGVFLASLGLIQFFTGWNPVGWIRIPGLKANYDFGDLSTRSIFARVQGTASHPIEFGVVLSVLLPLAMYHAWNAPPGKRWRGWLSVGVIAAAGPMTVARSAVLSTIVAVLVLFALAPARRRIAMLLAAPFFVVLLRLAAPGLVGTLVSLFTHIQDDPSTTGRTEDYGAVTYYVSQDPVFGRGLFTFMPSLYRTLDNQYLLWVVENGIVGLLALVVLIVTAVATALAVWRSPLADPRSRDLGAAMAASLAAAVVSFGTFDALGFPILAGVFFLELGLIGALWRIEIPRAVAYPRDGHPLASRRWLEARLHPETGWRATGRWLLRRAIAVTLVAIAVFAVSFTPLRQRVYVTDVAMILRGAPVRGANPYSDPRQFTVPLAILQQSMGDQRTREDLRAQGITGQFAIVAGGGSSEPFSDQRGNGPLVEIVVRSGDPAMTERTAEVVTALAKRRLVELQTTAGSPAAQLMQLVPFASSGVSVEQGSSKRAAGGAALLALFGSALLGGLVGKRRPRPRRASVLIGRATVSDRPR